MQCEPCALCCVRCALCVVTCLVTTTHHRSQITDQRHSLVTGHWTVSSQSTESNAQSRPNAPNPRNELGLCYDYENDYPSNLKKLEVRPAVSGHASPALENLQQRFSVACKVSATLVSPCGMGHGTLFSALVTIIYPFSFVCFIPVTLQVAVPFICSTQPSKMTDCNDNDDSSTMEEYYGWLNPKHTPKVKAL